jgi:Gpi18-like mannosyltransferase
MRSPGSAPVVPHNFGLRVSRLVRQISWLDAVFLLVALALAVALRIVLLDFKSLDYFASLKPWYNTIKDAGFTAFSTGFSTYNPPYLYLLYLIARFLPDLPTETAVKLPALLADFVCAGFVFVIIRSRLPHRAAVPYLAALTMLLAPTVVLNSAFWGQADSIYTAGILASVYFLGIRRPVLAVFAFSCALAFKLQAVFLLPLLLAMTIRGRIPWKALLLIPSVLFLAILPSLLAGRPAGGLLGVYAYQASQFETLTMNAPTVFALVPDTKRVFNLLYIPGVMLGAAVALLWFTLLLRSRRDLAGMLLVEAALVSMLLIPLFLPKMHERYFFPADILAICLAFLEPALFFVPIAVVGASFFAYQPFLFDRTYVPLPILSLVLIAVTAFLTHRAVSRLYAVSEPQLGLAQPSSADLGAQQEPGSDAR